MVALDQDHLVGALKIVSRLFPCFDNHQMIPTICVIVLFGQGALSRVESDWSNNPVSIVLARNGRNCEAASISLHDDADFRVEMLEDRPVGAGLNEYLKCEFVLPSSLPLR